ncbi:hypothetical protein L596_019417 [Steinernema carpocapsae]|uniref:Uncharacterized protein n=1 Tax=Steinernema carpocapsae TaxID=34508 RepID=A0A4V6A0K1_STECR|nr:hypothetical protein L596_019417 [Steinernema carpocapsae]
MTKAAKQPENPSKSAQKFPNRPKIFLSCTCRRGCRRQLAGLVTGGWSNSSLSPCRPATGRRQPRRHRHEFEHPIAVAHEVERYEM